MRHVFAWLFGSRLRLTPTEVRTALRYAIPQTEQGRCSKARPMTGIERTFRQIRREKT